MPLFVQTILLKAAQETSETAVALGEKNGIRNAQVTVLSTNRNYGW